MLVRVNKSTDDFEGKPMTITGAKDCISALDSRYNRKEIADLVKPYLTAGAYLEYLLKVECAITNAYADFKLCNCTHEIAQQVALAADSIEYEDVQDEERRIGHDIVALTNTLKKNLNEDYHNFIHMGATSYDIIDTANNLRYQQFLQSVFMPQLRRLILSLCALAMEHRSTRQIGMTHFQYAVPITFGFGLSNHIPKLLGCYKKLEQAIGEISGKYSGPVGAHNGISLRMDDPVEFEKYLISTKLGLKVSQCSTQTVGLDKLVTIANEIEMISNILANFATNNRLLQSSAVGETFEPYNKDRQKGSSAMPHKRNPVKSENITGASYILEGHLVTFRKVLVSWLQRDLANSIVGRTYPEILFWGLSVVNNSIFVIEGLEVDSERMLENLSKASKVFASEPLLNLMSQIGFEDPHEKLRMLSIQAKAENKDLLQIFVSDSQIIQFMQSKGDDFFENFMQKHHDLLKDLSNYTGTSQIQVENIVDEVRNYLYSN